jgi:hypothetical protein
MAQAAYQNDVVIFRCCTVQGKDDLTHVNSFEFYPALPQCLEDEFLLQTDAGTENAYVYRPVFFIAATSKT